MNGRNVTNRYGVTYVYAATALFRGTAPTSPPPPPTSTPTPPPTPGASVRVTTIPALLNALNDNAVTDIVVANGTYRVSPSNSQRSNSLWIGARFADRTNPVTVRAETRGGVTFDGGGAAYFGGISFNAGAHHQTWDGFKWVNGHPANGATGGTGVVVFGGYSGLAAPHHITIRNSLVRPIQGSNITNGHIVYFSYAVGGAHDITLDNFTVDDPNGWAASAFHFYHSDATNKNAWNVTIRNSRVTGTQQAFMVWDPTIHDLLVEDTTISGAKRIAVRYEQGSPITLRRVTSSGSGDWGFYSSKGSNPPGVSFIDSVLRYRSGRCPTCAIGYASSCLLGAVHLCDGVRAGSAGTLRHRHFGPPPSNAGAALTGVAPTAQGLRPGCSEELVLSAIAGAHRWSRLPENHGKRARWTMIPQGSERTSNCSWSTRAIGPGLSSCWQF